MSTSVDSRRRPNLWSYISFGSAPRRRSISLPTKNLNDPYEKADRHFNNYQENPPSIIDDLRAAWMNQSSRNRFLKVGGVVAFFVIVFFLLAPNERARVEGWVDSMFCMLQKLAHS
jgi:guanosine-diphosphatase